MIVLPWVLLAFLQATLIRRVGRWAYRQVTA